MKCTRFLVAGVAAVLLVISTQAARSHAAAPVVPPGGKTGAPVLDVAPVACPGLVSRGVPQSAINAALESPWTVYGFLMPVNPGRSLGPFNPPRRSLALASGSKPYHPLFNRVTFKHGCS